MKECDKPKPTKREASKGSNSKPNRAASKGKGRCSSKPSKPKAAAAAADEGAAARFCLRLKPRMKELIEQTLDSLASSY
eukprot:4934012-Amphidinium_carterae.1